MSLPVVRLPMSVRSHRVGPPTRSAYRTRLSLRRLPQGRTDLTQGVTAVQLRLGEREPGNGRQGPPPIMASAPRFRIVRIHRSENRCHQTELTEELTPPA